MKDAPASTSPVKPRGGAGREPPSWLAFPTVTIALTVFFLGFMALPRVNGNPRLVLAFGSVGAVLVAWQLFLWMRAKRLGQRLRVELVAPIKSHYIQGSVQLSVYAYWGWYWREVYHEAPLILAQLVFLYILDAMLSWTRGRAWRIGFGPLPITLSTNLFIWFRDDLYILQFLLVATCAVGKEFVRWQRDGKSTHIFNPSAFGLALFSMVLIFTGTTHYTWGIEIAQTLNYPPHIYLYIFSVGLIVEYFFHTTLMTFSAVASIWLFNLFYTGVNGTFLFIETNIPIAVFLGLHLLVTDPSTSPRTNSGRVIFGVLYGLGNVLLYEVLEGMHLPEFYDKLLPVPILNLTVRAIDRFTKSGALGRLTVWESRFRPHRLNMVHLAAWGVLFAGMLATGYVDAPHPGASIAFWKQAVIDDKPNADQKLLKMLGARAEQGAPIACNELGVVYMEGKIVPQDRAAAAHWFGKACEGGNVDGCTNVATQFLFQREFKSDADVARALDRLERRCGRKTDGRSCYLIGYAYEKGAGRPADAARAREAYEKGCTYGSVDASKGLVRLAEAGLVANVDLTRAAQLLEAACESGDGESCLYLAYLQQRGGAGPIDSQKALAYWQKACALGSERACAALKQSAAQPVLTADMLAVSTTPGYAANTTNPPSE
ncbi:MAG: hypothetical protein ACKVWV_16370 [Planctomycetota bacterium]